MVIRDYFMHFSLLLLLSCTCNVALAAAGWTNSASLTHLNQQPPVGVGADLIFVETTVSMNPSGCSHATGFYFAISNERQKRLFAMLLAAHLASRNVQIYTTGNCHVTWGYAELDGVVVD